MIRTKLKSNFWHPTQWDDDTHLYLDELGWNDAAQSDAHDITIRIILINQQGVILHHTFIVCMKFLGCLS